MNRRQPASRRGRGPQRRATSRLLTLGLAAALTVAGGTAALPFGATTGAVARGQDASCVESEQGGCLPVAPESARVDLVAPTFSNPTQVTNPLFPISELHSALLLGNVEGEPLRIEVTLLPETKLIEWNGQQVETLVSQFVAFVDGHIHEVALDFYAQADDGSVWYFGEDVFNYEDGIVADTDGTWLAGRDGPAALIMPAAPRVGDVYRPENMPGFIFEEVTVASINETVDGPRGAIAGAITVSELHQDGLREAKTFAPGYGEFLSQGSNDLEALALAVPTDALTLPLPVELDTLSRGAAAIFAAVEAEEWDAIAATNDDMATAWATYQAGDVPPLLASQMSGALAALGEAIDIGEPAETRQAAIAVGRSALDLRLRYESPADIDRARFDLWTLQLAIDAEAGDAAAVVGDVTSLEWARDRIIQTLDPATAERLNASLLALRGAVDAGDMAGATAAAAQLPLLRSVTADSEASDDSDDAEDADDDADEADEDDDGEDEDDDGAEEEDDADAA